MKKQFISFRPYVALTTTQSSRQDMTVGYNYYPFLVGEIEILAIKSPPGQPSNHRLALGTGAFKYSV